MNRNVRIIFFAHPRSGSSSLYEILQLHTELNILEEPFNENFTRWNINNKNYRKLIHDVPSLEVQVAEIFETHNGIKMLDYQLPSDLAVHMLRRPDCKVIFLRRRNILQSVVSVLIAEQTQLWKRWEMIKSLDEYYRNLQPLDLQDIQQRVAVLKQGLDFFESTIDARPRDEVMKLTYEDLYFSETLQQNQQITAIWNLLKIAPLELERYQYYLSPEAVKLNSNATYALLPNASEIQEYCGSDVTGWLYD
ncbi:MAG: sulfotransferase domain-containing protein [Anaerolineae bacterium]|nr:sulfotransferase domain-containing protein [Anaerolineae bacterium]MCI0608595.1 sulfotransferase domain-containing protein [Anaerolineae bacterium]